jgi:hypothetical protein
MGATRAELGLRLRMRRGGNRAGGVHTVPAIVALKADVMFRQDNVED